MKSLAFVLLLVVLTSASEEELEWWKHGVFYEVCSDDCGQYP